MTTEGVVLSYGFVPANPYNNIIAPTYNNEEKISNKALPFIRIDSNLDEYQFIDFTALVPSNSFQKLRNRITTDLNELNLTIHTLEGDTLRKATNVQEKINWSQKLLKN